MKNVKISVETSTYVTEEADPDDSWDRDNTSQDIDSWKAEVVDLKADKHSNYWNESIVVEVDDEADEVYAVVALYSTGDTFGNDSGQVYIADAFDDEQDAHDLLDEFKKYDDSLAYGSKVVPYNFAFKDKSYDLPWSGYFEHLERLYVETVSIS